MLNFKKNRMKKHTFCRFSILLSIILVFLLYPMSSMGAQKYISVKGEDMTIKQAIQLIEKNSEYTFFYNASDLENNTKRDYNSTGNIEKVLKDVFEGSNVSYVIKGKEVILKVTKTENTQQVKKRTIIGVVTASDIKEPIIGASIWLKNSSIGVITDVDGKYSIVIEGVGGVLEFSYIGYKKQEIALANQEVINVVLEPDTEVLDEVVVVGYGSQKKESVVGAISTLDMRKLNVPGASISNVLAGQLSGVVAMSRSGEPGKNSSADFYIRGVSSFKGTSTPLVLVDGIERDLDLVDTDDIATFSILKDASASVEMPEYQLQGNYDFQMQNNASRVVFSQRVKKVTKVKFAVESGAGNFVSCSEMEFFQKNPDNKLEQQLLAVFTDITCSELKPEATLEQINQLPGYFVNLATQLKNGTYDAWEKEFRIQDYQAYSDINVWADRLMTKHYSCLDNLTGIAVEANDEIIVLVGNTHGYPVALQCIGEETTSFGEEKNYVQTAASGDIYFLKEGVNKITIRNRGQLFVMYTADLQSNPTSIRIHIPLGSGQVTGYFDLQRHQTNEKYAELLSKATDKYFGVKGEKMIFYFHRSEMLKHVRTEILSAIHLWDNIVEWEQSLMGIDKMHANQFNNHLFAISPEGAYMWASDYRIAFVYTYLDNILLYDKVMLAEDNAWGPAHEIGHVHQLAIDWMGSTESSNNLFSNYIIYQLGKYKSRGRGLDYLAECVYGQNQAWYNMGSATHQGEDTEIHMRMNWQLWLYYELCKGHDKKPMVWPKIFELMRTTYQHVPTHQPGQRQMAFVKAVCDATQEDLTEFFETWGFFKAVDAPIEQYGQAQYTVTEQMICETKAYIQNKKYPKAAPIQYIEDRKRDFFPSSDPRAQESGDVGYYEVFKNHTKISKVPTYTLSSSHQGATIRVSDGEEAVAFEVRENEANSRLLYFSNSFTFTVPSKVYQSSAKVYAVQADGQRILLTAR